MLWPKKFIKGARPGLKRQAQVISDSTQVISDSATNAEKRFKYEQEKMPKRIFNAKWCEGRPWLKYDHDENAMTCTICTTMVNEWKPKSKPEAPMSLSQEPVIAHLVFNLTSKVR